MPTLTRTRWLKAVVGPGLLLFLLASAAHAAPVLDGVIAASSGDGHTCALLEDGRVFCWGRNQFGQLGLGHFTEQKSPVEVTGFSAAVAELSAGGSHTCARLVDGSAMCWGSNSSGQLGDGTTQIKSSPTAVSGLPGPLQRLSAGTTHTCAATVSGAALCWGNNFVGQLGDGSTTFRSVPTQVSGLVSGVSDITAGGRHSCAIINGGAQCWGGNSDGAIGDGTFTQRDAPVAVSGLASGVAQILASENDRRGTQSCARMDNGEMRCWGMRVISDAFQTIEATPTLVGGLGGTVLDIAIGGVQRCALVSGGAVACIGDNSFGQLGDGTTETRTSPVAVQGLEGTITRLAGGLAHTCAISSDKRLQCWGNNGFGQLGTGDSEDRVVATPVASQPFGLSRIATGFSTTCAVGTSGELACWGNNWFGQIGDDSFLTRLLPTQVGPPGSYQEVDTGLEFSCAIDSVGGVDCWGINVQGQLGAGVTDFNIERPTAVVDLDSPAVDIATGRFHTCAALQSGAARCWGDNTGGQLGDGGTVASNRPVAVSISGSAEQIGAGDQHSCARQGDGKVMCWGVNFSGQLGVPGGSSGTPVEVQGLPAAEGLAVGNNHACAFDQAGALYCWGSNSRGQLGVSGTFASATPQLVSGFDAPVTQVGAGDLHTCAVTLSGSLWCWGFNGDGQLGDGSTINRSTPVRVGNLTIRYARVDAGTSHSCAIDDTGAASCWGLSDYGRLGDGSSGGRFLPDTVIEDSASREIALASDGADDDSAEPVSDAQGRYVVFRSDSDSLVAGDNNLSPDIFRRDLVTGAVQRVSVDDAGQQISGASGEPSVSADGQLVVFVAPDAAVRKLRGESKKSADARRKGSSSGVFMRNMLTGSTRRVATAPETGAKPVLAPGGKAVVFSGAVSNPMQGVPGQINVFRVPLQESGGEFIPVAPDNPQCLSCADAGSGLMANGPSRNPVVSANGNIVVFETEASNLGGQSSPCANPGTALVMRNMLTGSSQTIAAPGNAQQCGAAGAGSSRPQVDYSGTRIAFESSLPLSGSDKNGLPDIYHLDLSSGALIRVSEGRGQADGNGAALEPRISGDGRTVSFSSQARNLVATEADNNGLSDVHVFSLREGSLRRLDRGGTGDIANGAGTRPALDYMGKRLAYESSASNLSASAAGGQSNIFVRETLVDPDTLFAHDFE
ncbi:hypothetical protein [Pseudomarimonas salicorniae]|uniref:RCC1-like domain-containing protein n=1 Tax=Pseudomarimonas salicorniae TaxID=2933270 RepID=A0ABT0GJV3_9GAMM|nr:hypothetical protein [Lysobacter sp. CAU 1642]MCK7594494.1 hypothetical protein [Lysobacter sp. CAU 1642]